MRRSPGGFSGAGGANGAGGASGASGNGGNGGAGGVEEILPAPGRHFGRVVVMAVEGSGAQAVAYWVNPVDSDSGLWRKAEGVDATRLVSGNGMIALALGPTDIYVAVEGAGIGKVAKDTVVEPTAGAAGAAPAPATLTDVIATAATGGRVQGLAVAGTTLYWLAVTTGGQLELHRAALDGTEARVLGRVQTKLPDYWAAPIGPSQIVVNDGFLYFADPGTVSGDLQDDNLSGVTGAADGAIYRLPQ
jgi:hypothetical protein